MKYRSDFIKLFLVLLSITTPGIAVATKKPSVNQSTDKSHDFKRTHSTQLNISSQSLKKLLSEGAISKTEYNNLAEKLSTEQDKNIKDLKIKSNKIQPSEKISYHLKITNDKINIAIKNLGRSDKLEIDKTNLGWAAYLHLLDHNNNSINSKTYNLKNYGIISIKKDPAENILKIDFVPIDKEKSTKPIVIVEDDLVMISLKESKASIVKSKSVRQRRNIRRNNRNRDKNKQQKPQEHLS